MWVLAWGPFIGFLEKREKEGKRTEALESMPELYADLVPVWEAWNELHKRRSIGFSVNPISVGEIVAYLDLQGVEDREQRCYYFRLIGALDEEWLVWARKKSKETGPADGKSKNPGAKR